MFQKNAQVPSGEKRLSSLDERLSAYYGPALPPHQLSESAWLRLCAQLEQERRLPLYRAGMRWPGQMRVKRGQAAPEHLQTTFATLLSQVEYRRPAPELRCTFSARPLQPRVRTSPLGRGQVRLILPEHNWLTLQELELEVLLASGLARCSGASRALFVLVRALVIASFLLALTALPFTSADRRSLWIFGLAFACCVAGACLISWQERALAFQGDRQAVQWLGRERVCQGLHLLAEHDRPRRRPAWGEPSLAERIARVCGSSLKTKDEHLTLVG